MKSSRQIVVTISLLFLCTSIAAAQGEKVDAEKLPQKVAEALKARFPGATITQVTKETENGEVLYDIEMTRAGKKHEMDCKEDGTLIDIQNEVAVKDLPAAAIDAIKARYPNSTIKEVGEILVVKDKKETRDHFEVMIDTADGKEVELTVSLDGKIVE